MTENITIRDLILQVKAQNPEMEKKELVEEVFRQVKEDGFYTVEELEAIREEISERVYNS
jgi:hypothetical protein